MILKLVFYFMPNEFFISYSRKDSGFVNSLFASLKAHGIDPWIDFEDIKAASYWRQEIAVGIQYCHNFIFCLSPESVASVECLRELEHALAMEKRIIPIVLRPTPQHLIHEGLKEINWIFFDDFNKGFQQLLNALEAPLGFTFGGRLDAKIEINVANQVRIFYLYRNRYLIGRYPKSEGEDFKAGLIFIGDKYVSRISATLQMINNRWFLGDGLVLFNSHLIPVEFHPSKNGNQINGKVQKPRIVHCLVSGDSIRLGPNTNMTYIELRPDDADEIGGDDKETWV